ncbi:hypothetical protein KIN20_020163 [Parelaphostrongylus tenuis]|uniref:Uncharacterized protein n=1 Tax=Parelaphostrongylus tenuis TaxID=148309 RepID=A0AAD5QVF3_PARTN|nr:hypothetical protein KIN20_020163 [Parelaphostrongylus tenuis]
MSGRTYPNKADVGPEGLRCSDRSSQPHACGGSEAHGGMGPGREELRLESMIRLSVPKSRIDKSSDRVNTIFDASAFDEFIYNPSRYGPSRRNLLTLHSMLQGDRRVYLSRDTTFFNTLLVICGEKCSCVGQCKKLTKCSISPFTFQENVLRGRGKTSEEYANSLQDAESTEIYEILARVKKVQLKAFNKWIETTYFDPKRKGNVARFITHGYLANLTIIRYAENDLRLHRSRAILFANQLILGGSEVIRTGLAYFDYIEKRMKELDGRAKLFLSDEGIRDEGGIWDPEEGDREKAEEYLVLTRIFDDHLNSRWCKLTTFSFQMSATFSIYSQHRGT